MKTKRIVALLLVAVLSLGILASCGGSDCDTTSAVKELEPLSISDVYNSDIDWDSLSENDPVFTQISDYEFLGNKEIVLASSDYVVYENTTVDPIKYVIYNLRLEKEVCSIDESKIDDEDDIVCTRYYVSIVTIDENDKATTTVYSNKGDIIYTTDGYYSIDEDEYEESFFCRIGDKLYRKNPKDCTLTAVATLPAIWENPGNLVEIDDAFVSVNDYSIAYYSKTNFDIIASYIVPGYYDDSSIALLANGDALIQTTTYLDDSALEFDVYEFDEDENLKCNIDNFIFSYSDNSIKEIDFGSYLIIPQILTNKLMDVESDFAFYSLFNEDIENIAYAVKVENHHPDISNIYVVSLNNDGEIAGHINSQVDHQEAMIEPWGNYLIVSNPFATFILDRDGNVVKQIHSDSVNFHDFGIYDYDNRKIYNEKLEVIKDFEDCSIHESDNSYIIYSTVDGEGNESYYFYTKAGDKKIAIPAGFEFYNDYYSVAYDVILSGSLFCFTVYSYNEETYETTYKYRYYNNEGTFLFESDYRYSRYKSFEDYAIIRAYNSAAGNYVYKKAVAAQPSVAQ